MLLSDNHGKGEQFAKYHKACRKLRHNRSIITKQLTKKKGNKIMSDEQDGVAAAPEAAPAPESAPATEAPASEEKSE